MEMIPEMVVNAAKIACKYRNKFKKDIVIDLFCYRRRGHNELMIHQQLNL
jgi:2-oxoglutarate dehydrogenase E1 component